MAGAVLALACDEPGFPPRGIRAGRLRATGFGLAAHVTVRCPRHTAEAGQFARFTPDLRSGRYHVSLSEQTPFSVGTEFDVRIRHRHGEQIVRLRPTNSRNVGSFEFDEGTDGFVQIEADGSKGLVVADAVLFRPE